MRHMDHACEAASRCHLQCHWHPPLVPREVALTPSAVPTLTSEYLCNAATDAPETAREVMLALQPAQMASLTQFDDRSFCSRTCS
jgi:hypothetical protein